MDYDLVDVNSWKDMFETSEGVPGSTESEPGLLIKLVLILHTACMLYPNSRTIVIGQHRLETNYFG